MYITLLFRKKFKKFDPPEDVMKYTVNNMTNKFLLKELGFIDSAVTVSIHNGTIYIAHRKN